MARKKQTTLVLFPEILSVTRKLSDEQFGVLMRAAFSYRLNGEVYSGNDVAVDVAFQFVSNQIDRYMENCAVNARNASNSTNECSEIQRNAAEYSRNTPPIRSYPYPYPIQSGEREADKPPKPALFSPPSVDEVREYCTERGYTTIDPERFVSYYAARGWKSGQTAISDWRAAADSWHREDISKANNTTMPYYGGEENWSI